MKLFYSNRSPYVRKVMVLAHERGLVGQIETIDTTVNPTETIAPLEPQNPLAKIPTLVTDDGTVLYDSPVICEYLDSVASGPKLFPAAGAQRWAALRQQALGDGILDSLILWRYENVNRPEAQRWADWTEGQMGKARRGLAAMAQEDLSGERTIGTLTCGVVLSYIDFRFPEEDWRGHHPKLAAWHETIVALPSMMATEPPKA